MVDLTWCEARLVGPGDDGAAEGVLGFGFDRGGKRQEVAFADAIEGDHLADRGFASRQSPGLVEEDDVDRSRRLERPPVADQEPVARRDRRRYGNDQRDREPQRVWAGNDEHGDCALDAETETSANGDPRDERDDTRGDRHERQKRRRTVGEHLGTRAAGLRFGNEPHDPGERRALADRGDPGLERSVAVDRAGDHLRADDFLDRARLAGDHRFIDRGGSLDELAVGRDPRTRAHEDQIANAKLGERDAFGSTVPDPLRLVGKQLGELLQRALRAIGRPHFQPVPEEHHGDEGRELPEERVAAEDDL